MSSTDRQNRLLQAEDWKKIYQSFRNAEFRSYDFDNLRRTMIDYIRQNYPEDFNDYIESSEYLALIDVIAFLGQNISFRLDLNARENFIELAERRESVLRLASLLSYNPRRNKAANGLLKITSVTTSENIQDSNGQSLNNKAIVWNDSINPNWFEQYIKVLNAALPSQNQFGRPTQFENVAGIPTEQYRFNSSLNGVPIFTFTKSVNNKNLKFEVVSTGIENGNIIEESPNPQNQLGFVYRDNGQGAGSTSTGFFLHFREGNLQRGDFLIENSVPNQRIDVDVSNINQTDVWLYSVNDQGIESELWTKVDAVEGNNIVYNSISKKIRNIYSVLTRVDDRISLIFSDGIFGNIPSGRFRAYYRTSINRDYTILPANITNVSIKVPYVSKIGRIETLTLGLTLQVAVDNASSSESTESIRNNAPSTYYTQNRLITGEDYNIGPLGVSQDIIKTKSVNRTASGISRYFDILDSTGKYSKTVLFGTDGVVYKEIQDKKTNFQFVSRTDIERIIENTITPILRDDTVRNFYLDKFPNQEYVELEVSWSQVSKDTNRSTGVIKDSVVAFDEFLFKRVDTVSTPYQVSSFTSGLLRFIEPGAIIKFQAPDGYVFNSKNELVLTNNKLGSTSYIWTKVVSVTNDGTGIRNGLGGIVLNDVIPTGAIIKSVKPKYNKEIIDSVKMQIIDQIFNYKTFGLRYDIQTKSWRVILDDNLNVFDDFSLNQAGDVSSQQLDSSWLLIFETNGVSYDITYRSLRYVFESDKDIRFFFDTNKKIYDVQSGSIINDKINVLGINNKPNETSSFTVDFEWKISNDYRDQFGYVNSKKVEILFADKDEDGIIDNPEIFTEIVGDNIIFTKKKFSDGNEFDVFVSQTDEKIWIVSSNRPNDNEKMTRTNKNITEFDHGDVIYNELIDTFEIADRNRNLFIETFLYKAFSGRNNLKFQYVHVSDENRRIDPSSTNIIDTYILTRQYDDLYRRFLTGAVAVEPLPPSSDSLFLSFNGEISKIKSISDEIIYHPVKYKPLFGNKSNLDLQASFKVVKNPSKVISDSEIKTRIISSINKFFALDNWDFGDTFYFAELSAFIMKDMSPDIVSILIVPRSARSSFGNLFEIKAESDEIFISCATVDDVEIITANTADKLKVQGAFTTLSDTSNTGIRSAQGLNISTTTGGFTF